MTVAPQSLRILHVEDDPHDAELVQRELRRDGLAATVERVENEAAYVAALKQREWDVILADFRLPGFNALRALTIYRELQLDLPFILVSGTVDDEAALVCMRAGAHDYLLKDRMARLVPVVRREYNIRLERRRAEERYRLLVENCNDLIAEITGAGEVRYASPNHLSQLALDPAHFVGGNIFDHVHADDRAAVRQLLENENRRGAVYRFHGGDGSTHWLESSGRVFLTAAGEERIVVITRDITEKRLADETRQRLEAQLRQAQKLEAIGTLAGGIAHDFNNILTGIVGNVQLAQFEIGDHHTAIERLDDALNASERARDLVAQILTFSRQREATPVVTRIDDVITEAMRLLRASLPATIAFTVELDPLCPAIVCDPSQIHQIVMNLGTNAAYAMRERGGELRVTLTRTVFDPALLDHHPQLRPGSGVCLAVADTGCGIDAATQERLFEPFFTTKPVGEGTGLGLAVVHGIVKSHDAAIAVESAPGEGTTIRIYFPAAVANEPVPAAAEPSSLPRGHGERLLLIDDEPTITMIAELMLERLGYKVDTFSDPAAALAAFNRAPGSFRAVITDLAMPGTSGLEIARAVRSVRPDVPILVMSGNMHINEVARAKAAGVCAIVEKPFSIQTLAQSVATAITANAKSA